MDARKGYGDSKAGDVISICPDGWKWSKAERENPVWRIIRVPLLKIECDALLARGDGDPMLEPCHKRKYKVDFDKLATAEKDVFTKARAEEVTELSAKTADIRAAVTLKAKAVAVVDERPWYANDGSQNHRNHGAGLFDHSGVGRRMPREQIGRAHV